MGHTVRQPGGSKPEGIVREESATLRWDTPDLQSWRKGDPRKVRIAARLRRETTMTLAWIAERLRMGAGSHVACLLYRRGKEEEASENTLF